MKYDLRMIMNGAWSLVRRFGMKLSDALKKAWNAAKAAMIIKAGAKRWQKNGMDRLYINYDILGYDCGCYNTGNIAWATLNGKQISNCEMRRVLDRKTWIDTATLELHSTYRAVEAVAQAWMNKILHK